MQENLTSKKFQNSQDSKFKNISIAFLSSLAILTPQDMVKADTWDKQPIPENFVNNDANKSCDLVKKYSRTSGNNNIENNKTKIQNKIEFTGSEIINTKRNNLFDSMRENGTQYYGTDKLELWKIEKVFNTENKLADTPQSATESLLQKLGKNIGNKKIEMSEYDYIALTSSSADTAWDNLKKEMNIQGLPDQTREKAEQYLDKKVKQQYFEFYEFLKTSEKENQSANQVLDLEKTIFSNLNYQNLNNEDLQSTENNSLYNAYLRFFDGSDHTHVDSKTYYESAKDKMSNYLSVQNHIKSKFTKSYNSNTIIEGTRFKGTLIDFLHTFTPKEGLQNTATTDQIFKVYVNMISEDPRFGGQSFMDIQQYAYKETYKDIEEFVIVRDSVHQSIIRKSIDSKDTKGNIKRMITPVSIFINSKEFESFKLPESKVQATLNEYQLYDIQERNAGNKSKQNYYSKIANVTQGIHDVEDLLNQETSKQIELEKKPMQWSGLEIYDLMSDSLGSAEIVKNIDTRDFAKKNAIRIKLLLEVSKRANIYTKKKFLFWEEKGTEKTQILEDDDLNKLYTNINPYFTILEREYLKRFNELANNTNTNNSKDQVKIGMKDMFEDIANKINQEIDSVRNDRLTLNSRLKEIGNMKDCSFVSFPKSGSHNDMDPVFIKQVLDNTRSINIGTKYNNTNNSTDFDESVFDKKLRSSTISILKMMDPELKNIAVPQIEDTINAFIDWVKVKGNTENQYILDVQKVRNNLKNRENFESINWTMLVQIAGLMAMASSGLYLKTRAKLAVTREETQIQRLKNIKVELNDKTSLNIHPDDIEMGNLTRKENRHLITVIDENSGKELQKTLDDLIMCNLFDKHKNIYEVLSTPQNIFRIFDKFEESNSVIDVLVGVHLLFNNLYGELSQKLIETNITQETGSENNPSLIKLRDLVTQISQNLENLTNLYTDINLINIAEHEGKAGTILELKPTSESIRVKNSTVEYLQNINTLVISINNEKMAEYLETLDEVLIKEVKFIKDNNIKLQFGEKLNGKLYIVSEYLNKIIKQLNTNPNITGIEAPTNSFRATELTEQKSLLRIEISKYLISWEAAGKSIMQKNKSKTDSIKKAEQERIENAKKAKKEAEKRNQEKAKKEQEKSAEYEKQKARYEKEVLERESTQKAEKAKNNDEERKEKHFNALKNVLETNLDNETFGLLSACTIFILLKQFIESPAEKTNLTKLIDIIMFTFENLDHHYTADQISQYQSVCESIKTQSESQECSPAMALLSKFITSKQLDKFINGTKFERLTEEELLKFEKLVGIYNNSN